MAQNPFAPSTSRPGCGKITLALLPPSTPVLQDVSYQYPLKLIAPSALSIDGNLIHTVFLLTYGGGLVAGDTINLNIRLDPTTHLILLTQGSTKIFKTPSPDLVSGQSMTVQLTSKSALVYLPDPVQPFENSAFRQTQIYELLDEDASLCVCDWVCSGRAARGENWNIHEYKSKNEVWWSPKYGKRKLLLRDNIILDGGEQHSGALIGRMDSLGVFGTLILKGPVFESLGKYFMDEFAALPRVGGRTWDEEDEIPPKEEQDEEVKRKQRQKLEVKHSLLWTAANLRGFVLVKFGSRNVEGVKDWLSMLLRTEGGIEKQFGERALLCLR